MRRFSAALMLAAVALAGCGQAVTGGRDGSLSISVGAVQSQSAQEPEAQLTVENYLFSGSGPDGRTFSLQSEDGTATLANLAAGLWTVDVEARNADGLLLYSGEATVDVQPYSAVTLDIALAPVPGSGSVWVTAVWNGELTLDPSVSVSLTDSANGTVSYQLPLAATGRAERTIDGLQSGSYRVALQLHDSGQKVMGHAAALRIFTGLTRELRAELGDLNKVGKPLVIEGESFAIAWDPPSEYLPAAYRVYFRHRGDHDWLLLDEITADEDPQFTVTGHILPYGTYELAVSALTDGVESALHTSMADDAQPATGWYVEWSGP